MLILHNQKQFYLHLLNFYNLKKLFRFAVTQKGKHKLSLVCNLHFNAAQVVRTVTAN